MVIFLHEEIIVDMFQSRRDEILYSMRSMDDFQSRRDGIIIEKKFQKIQKP